MPDKWTFAFVATGSFGKHASKMNNSARSTPLTKEKYRTKGIRCSVPPVKQDCRTQDALIKIKLSEPAKEATEEIGYLRKFRRFG